MIKPKVVLLIFVSGKIVLTGAKVGIGSYAAFDFYAKLCTSTGQRRNLYGIQHYLYCALRIP